MLEAVIQKFCNETPTERSVDQMWADARILLLIHNHHLEITWEDGFEYHLTGTGSFPPNYVPRNLEVVNNQFTGMIVKPHKEFSPEETNTINRLALTLLDYLTTPHSI